ncbi:hypothetical protein M3J09_012263 [Ascochyta lentis]
MTSTKHSTADLLVLVDIKPRPPKSLQEDPPEGTGSATPMSHTHRSHGGNAVQIFSSLLHPGLCRAHVTETGCTRVQFMCTRDGARPLHFKSDAPASPASQPRVQPSEPQTSGSGPLRPIGSRPG